MPALTIVRQASIELLLAFEFEALIATGSVPILDQGQTSEARSSPPKA